MVYRIVLGVVIAICVILLTLSLTVNAQSVEPTHSGLAIAPTTQDITVKSGESSRKSIEVANYSDKQLIVTLQAKEFTTTDYSYDVSFSNPTNDWVRFEQNRIVLEAGQEKIVPVTIDVPQDVAPKSYYFAVFASADMPSVGFKQMAQVVSLLMTKVEGEWIQTGVIDADRVSFWNLDSKIRYRFDAENTGNIHYSIVVFGQIENLFGGAGKQQGAGHMLIPGAKRAIEGSVASPILPGLYKLTYGYTLGSGSAITSKTVLIVFIPPWAIILCIMLVVFGIKIWRSRRQKQTT